ncbi:DUF4198 domain-containing protein [Sphingomonas sp. AOB5]|uniref:DUF4198 domain-containing protein n=1 Tax=Sphingomonas sp. AOB5 TaxID=3034017 RepID=UPI0023F6E2B8|nr:DUF4198 domain-containing protein [Sphingomonas sp. AOB5]MDF7773736.1 DUF4198 domain-containing protein [Sphingomonas sp. AOB5]
MGSIFKRAAGLAAGITLIVAGVANAHMPYILPTLFDITGDHITVTSAFAEDAFVPEVAMRDAPFHLIKPDGTRGEVGPVTYLRDLSIFEADVKADGTYRITTGQRAGRKSTMYHDGTKWIVRGESDDPIPADAKLVDVQSMTLADAYVTKGAQTGAALKPFGAALEIQAITHPNSIAAGEAAQFVLLFDGKPLAGAEITLFRSAGVHDGKKLAATVRSDAAGKFALTPADAGTYLVLVRHRAEAPAGSPTPYRSYTYTLAFDAV